MDDLHVTAAAWNCHQNKHLQLSCGMIDGSVTVWMLEDTITSVKQSKYPSMESIQKLNVSGIYLFQPSFILVDPLLAYPSEPAVAAVTSISYSPFEEDLLLVGGMDCFVIVR